MFVRLKKTKKNTTLCAFTDFTKPPRLLSHISSPAGNGCGSCWCNDTLQTFESLFVLEIFLQIYRLQPRKIPLILKLRATLQDGKVWGSCCRLRFGQCGAETQSVRSRSLWPTCTEIQLSGPALFPLRVTLCNSSEKLHPSALSHFQFEEMLATSWSCISDVSSG